VGALKVRAQFCPLMRKSVMVTAAMVRRLLSGRAAGQGSRSSPARLLLLTRRLKPERVYADIDWSLLLAVLAGLFIVVGGLEKAVFLAPSCWPRRARLKLAKRPR